MSFRIASLALGQSYDCPSASEVTLKDMGKMCWHLTTIKHNKLWTVHILHGMYSYLFPNKVWTVGIFHGIYYIYLPNNQFPQDLKLVITQSGYRELAIYMLQQLYVTQSVTDMGQWPNYVMITFLLFILVKAVSRLHKPYIFVCYKA